MTAPDDRHRWVEPGAYPVAPGVWRIPTVLPLDGLRAVNIYAISDGDRLTLIDGGWALDEARQSLVSGLKEIGAGLGDIGRFLVTHVHRDHYTNAIAVRREYGTPVLIGIGEKPTIDVLSGPPRPHMRTQARQLYRHGASAVAEAMERLGAGPEPSDGFYETPDEWIADAQEFTVGDRVLQAIHTPGHTRGHVVFADRAAGVLFAGDHVLPHITPSIGIEVSPPPDGLSHYLTSLRLIRALPDMELLPAHGPAGSRVHERVDALLAHHDQRLAEMKALVPATGTTAYDVATRIGWTSRHRAFADLDPFNRMLGVFETVLHLELLADRGDLTRSETDGVQTYARPPAT